MSLATDKLSSQVLLAITPRNSCTLIWHMTANAVALRRLACVICRALSFSIPADGAFLH